MELDICRAAGCGPHGLTKQEICGKLQMEKYDLSKPCRHMGARMAGLRKVEEVFLMKSQKPYTPPVWEFILLRNEDIVTTSGWNNNGNGNGNGNWKPHKPGGGHKG